MGKKKAFVDKKNAVTYNLIYRSTEQSDVVPERLLVEADKGVGVGRPDVEAAAQQHAAHAASGRRYPPSHPLAWLEDEDEVELSDERRRELLQLGFPDDGYDYLKHMRTLGRGTGSLEGLAAQAAETTAEAFGGPSVFVPAAEVAAPEEDVRLFDATRLTLMQHVDQEEEAEGLMGGVTAFSRERRGARAAEQRELSEIDALMRALEEEEFEEEGGEGAEGIGDLLDDFVVTATEVVQEPQGPAAEEEEEENGDEAYDPEEGSELDLGSDYASGSEEGQEGGLGAGRAGGSMLGPARPGSIASTYWREERRDRKELLAVIDERFEHLALEYDEDEIGEMEDKEEEIGGPATLGDFQSIIDEFAATHTQSQRAYEDNVPYTAPGYRSAIGKQLEAHGLTDEDAAVALQKAHEALRQAEEAEHSGGEEEREVVWLRDSGKGAVAAQERWDCESVISLRSNLDNHPGKIHEPAGGKRGGGGSAAAQQAAAARGAIRLGRHGIPMGVLPRKPTAAALRQLGAASGEQAAAAGRGSDEDGDVADEAGAREAGAGSGGQVLQRRKGEGGEEKKARKTAVKEAKREARANKKALKEMFKEEATKSQRLAATAPVQAAIRLD